MVARVTARALSSSHLCESGHSRPFHEVPTDAACAARAPGLNVICRAAVKWVIQFGDTERRRPWPRAPGRAPGRQARAIPNGNTREDIPRSWGAKLETRDGSAFGLPHPGAACRAPGSEPPGPGPGSWKSANTKQFFLPKRHIIALDGIGCRVLAHPSFCRPAGGATHRR